jgi:uncharacterized protein
VAADHRGSDRFGVSWRPEYAAGILCHADEIDTVEIIAENFLRDGASARSLRTLSAQIPITLHSVALGLASSIPVETKRVEKLARLFDHCTPLSWSEHFAFVRAVGREIGHLAAPPRNDETIEGTIRNVRIAERIIGSAPLLENIATLITPPLSTYSEWAWMDHIVGAASCDLLLDLHNLLANCVNGGVNPEQTLRRTPLHRVRVVHLSGGKWIKDPLHPERRHLLDDHLHDVPGEVYELLATLAELCPNPLTVIIERDGNFPEFEIVLDQLRRAKTAVAAGRARRMKSRAMEVRLEHA